MNEIELELAKVKSNLDYKQVYINDHDSELSELRREVIILDKEIVELKAAIDTRNRIITVALIPGIIACLDILTNLI